MTHANGVVTNYTYDAASQLLSLSHQLGATTIDSFTYSYDKVGNRKSKADNNGTANYTYDALNRLVQAINPLPTNPLENYTYDAVGNRTNSNQNGASVFNQGNQLLEDAYFTYQYDNNGNLTRKTGKVGGAVTTYDYDAENKLIRVGTAEKTVNYKYDGLGRRVEKEVIDVGTATTRYVYDNEDILLELNGANSIVARYTHGPGIDEPLIMEKNGQSFYYHGDGSRLDHRNHQSKRRCGSALCVFIVRQDRVAVRCKLRAAVHVYGEGTGFGSGIVLLSQRYYDCQRDVSQEDPN